jgi:hypothetical protein
MKTVILRVVRGAVAAIIAATFAFLDFSVAYAAGELQNPLKFNDIQSFIAGALKTLVVVALPIITLFIVISGFMFVAALGKPDKLSKAKENFVYVIIGALLILGAWVLATLIGGTVSQVVGPTT